jgi:2-iminobutanoate/2-iminopropanoate deaminase
MRKQIIAKNGAKPQGPYSPAILASGPTLYVAGQVPVDPATGKLRPGSFKEQADLAFQNVTALLEAAGTSWAHVVKVGVFLADLGNFAEMNEIYQKYLTEPYPARTTVQVVLPPTIAIEVDCIALIPEE